MVCWQGGEKVETEFGRILDPAVDSVVAILFVAYLLSFSVFDQLAFALVALYVIKYILVLLKRNHDLGGGRMAIIGMFFIKIFADFYWIQSKTILLVLVIWNCMSIFPGLYFTRAVAVKQS